MNIVFDSKKQEVRDVMRASVSACFQAKGVDQVDFRHDETLVLTETPLLEKSNPTFLFEYDLFQQGEIGRRIVLKKLSLAIFKQSIDPRILTGIYSSLELAPRVDTTTLSKPLEVKGDNFGFGKSKVVFKKGGRNRVIF